LVSASVGKDQGETHGLHAPFCPIRIVAANGGTLIDLAGQAARRPDNQPHHKGHDTMARIARTREQMFANLKNMYPAKEPDDALSFEAFTLAIDHGLTPTELMMDAIDQQGYAKDGRDVPPLVEFLLAKCWIESVAA
jgi:hypothetical protein